jgi:hypothetical protein
MRVRWKDLSKRPLPHDLLAWGIPAVVFVIVYLADGSGFHPSGDGFYSWMYARSLAFDGDVHFANDYALCGDPYANGLDRGGGRPDNPFYMGPAFFWTPVLFLLKVVGRLFQSEGSLARSSCTGWLAGATIMVGPLLGATTALLAYRVARRFASSGAALLVALVFAFSSPLFPYSTSVAHYSHVYLAFSVAALIAATLAAEDAPRSRGRWAIVGILSCVCVLNRLHAAIYLLGPGLVALRAWWRDRRNPVGLVAVGLGAVAGVALTAWVYKLLYATWFKIPMGEHYIQFSRPHPLMLLFGVQGGFFFWMPVAWLAVLGVVRAVRDPASRLWAIALGVSSLLEIYLSSAPVEVYGGWSIGARRLLPLYAPLVFFGVHGLAVLAPLAARIPKGLRVRSNLVAGTIVGAFVVNNVPVSTIFRGDVAYSQAVLYGAGYSPFWSFMDRHVGDVAILPAELFFAARYRLPVASYRDGITHRYQRNWKTLAFWEDEISLASPWVANVSEGLSPAPGGVRLAGARARLVFCAEWPFATHVHFTTTAAVRTSLRLRIRKVFGTSFEGAVDVEPGLHRQTTLDLPPDAFDSGMLEIVFERVTGGAPEDLVLESIRFEDRTPRVPLERPPTADRK